jgi:hypothetical protein
LALFQRAEARAEGVNTRGTIGPALGATSRRREGRLVFCDRDGTRMRRGSWPALHRRRHCCGPELAPLEFGEVGENPHHPLYGRVDFRSVWVAAFHPPEPISTGISNGGYGATCVIRRSGCEVQASPCGPLIHASARALPVKRHSELVQLYLSPDSGRAPGVGSAPTAIVNGDHVIGAHRNGIVLSVCARWPGLDRVRSGWPTLAAAAGRADAGRMTAAAPA